MYLLHTVKYWNLLTLCELLLDYGEDKWGAQFTLILLWFYSLVPLIRIFIALIYISMISDVTDSCNSEYNLKLVFTFGSRNVWGHLRLFVICDLTIYIYQLELIRATKGASLYISKHFKRMV
jgi:hypothetical protein